MSDLATVLARMLDPLMVDSSHRRAIIEEAVATPEGKALAALVEAALEWRDSVESTPMRYERRLYVAIDAYREATR